MKMLGALSLMLSLSGSVAATPSDHLPPTATVVDRAPGIAESFSDAQFAPADITLLLHMEGAAGIRKELADRPIAKWMMGVFNSGQFHHAWLVFAQAAKVDGGQLFDVLLGERFTLLIRGDEWTLITQVPKEPATKLLQQLKVRVRDPKAYMAVFELPEQDVLIARDEKNLVIGPTKASELFYDLLPRLASSRAENPVAPSLANHPGIAKSKDLGAGRIGLFMRHDPPMGGWSAAVADLAGDQLTIRHAAHFDAAPFNHGETKLECDFSPLQCFSDQTLLAFVEPTDIGDGPLEAYALAVIQESLCSTDMQANRGSRRLIVVGEEDGRQQEPPHDLLSTSVVSCIEVKDRAKAVPQLDQQMTRLAKAIQNLAQGSLLKHQPEVRCLGATEPRMIDLSTAANALTGGFPIMKSISLNWTVADGPHGAWFVIGTHPRSLSDVVKALHKGAASTKQDGNETRIFGKFDSCGIGNGQRIGPHLRSWSDQALQFTEPKNADEFRQTLMMMSDFASGMQKCCWQLARPSANEMRLDLQIKLSAPESARGE